MASADDRRPPRLRAARRFHTQKDNLNDNLNDNLVEMAAERANIPAPFSTMIIVAQKMGLLGNMLEQYAHLIAFNKEHGVAISQMGFSDYAAHFSAPSRDLFCRYPCGRTALAGILARKAVFKLLLLLGRLNLLRWIPGAAVVTMDWQGGAFDLSDPGFIALAKSRKLVFLRGGWQHRYWTAYEKHIGTVRDFFKVAEPHASNVRVLAENTAEHQVTAGIEKTFHFSNFTLPAKDRNWVLRVIAVAVEGPIAH